MFMLFVCDYFPWTFEQLSWQRSSWKMNVKGTCAGRETKDWNLGPHLGNTMLQREAKQPESSPNRAAKDSPLFRGILSWYKADAIGSMTSVPLSSM